MPYCARKYRLTNSLVYHVFNRGNARQTVFHSDSDYRFFIELLKDYTAKFNLKLYHWVIMPNHYHLLLELEKPRVISKMMAGLNRAYTCYYHRVYLTVGFLWQGRFKSQPIEKECYLITCARYIERNPVRAGIVTQAQDYPYSSAQFYCLGKNDQLTVEDPYFADFGPSITERRFLYRKFLLNFDEEKEKSFSDLEQPQGSREFLRRLIKENGRYIPKRRGRPKLAINS